MTHFVDARSIGRAAVTVISEGEMRWAPELRAPEDEWRAAMPEADAEGAIPLGLNVVHIRTPHASILIDPGFDDPDSAWQSAYAAEVPGLRRSPGLEVGLAGIDVAAEEITHVLITHAHTDHYCGVTRDRDDMRVPRFPNARHLVGRREWEGNPERERRGSDLAARLGMVESAGLLDLVDAEEEVAPGVRVIPAPGESPGHCVVRLRSEGETFYYLGDLFHHPCEVEHPDWVSRGRDPAALTVSRARIAADAVRTGATIVFTHERFPPWGRIVPTGAGHRWVRGQEGRRREAWRAPTAPGLMNRRRMQGRRSSAMSETSIGRSKLGLGGHSYIEQLGNDPRPSFAGQCALVTACLDSGVTLFDTTYYQERVALGRVLRELGRRHEAEIAAWNFFAQPGREDDLVPWTPYEPHHIDVMLRELQTDRVDILVVHAEEDDATLRRGLDLAGGWVRAGKVREVALGMAGLQHVRALSHGHPVAHVFAPYNAFNREAAPMFAEARRRGMGTVAMSPFIRGWKLDEIGEDTAAVADILLRWVATQELVDRVIVSMRRAEWVRANLRSAARGPLSPEEQNRLAGWLARVG
jgi:aryl-alcohol dehydrogenase-like predicted oxidoreductase